MKNEILERLRSVDVAAYDIYTKPKIKNDVNVNNEDDPTSFEVGCIAQQLHEIFPQLVSTPKKKDGGWKVDYVMMVPMLILGYKDSFQKIEALEKEIKKLKNKIK